MKRLNQNHSSRFFFALMATIIALLVTSAVAFAQNGARVYLQPLDSADGILTVDVIADNVTDMYGAEFELKFDPAVLSVQDAKPDQPGIQIEAGTLLPVDQGFIVANKVNQAEGSIIFALTLLNPAPPATGSGSLARVTFNVLTTAPSLINVERSKLVAVNLQTIPSNTMPLAIGSQSQALNQPEPAAPIAAEAPQAIPIAGEFPWWIVAAAMMVLGVPGLIAFIIMTGLTSPKTVSQPQYTQISQPRPRQVLPIPQPPPKRPEQRPTRTRPSAFK